MTAEEAEREAKADYEKRYAEAATINRSYDEEDARIDAMTAKVMAWTPPTHDHVEMKKFMLQQLSVSKTNYRCQPPAPLDGAAWLAHQIDTAKRDIKYHLEENAKEIDRANNRTQWLKDLRSSLQ